MILESIKTSFEEKEQRGWDSLYYYFDIHGTILVPDYDNTTLEFYPFAKEALQLIANYPSIVIGLYTCSYPKEIARYVKFFKENNINFRYVNKNPEVANTRLGCFTDKLYFNVLFEDKAGFRPYQWEEVYNFFKEKTEALPKEEENEDTVSKLIDGAPHKLLTGFITLSSSLWEDEENDVPF